jgi:hypothetical protein
VITSRTRLIVPGQMTSFKLFHCERRRRRRSKLRTSRQDHGRADQNADRIDNTLNYRRKGKLLGSGAGNIYMRAVLILPAVNK